MDEEAEDLIRCKHYMDDRQVPCPPRCPYQSWPEYLFRRTFFTGRWKLRR